MGKNRKPPEPSIDKLAIIKAAAWAWYQHGSGCEERSKREFDLTRLRRSPKPSRYRLEAMRDANSRITSSGSHPFESPGLVLSPYHTGMTLFDSYEIMSISSELGREFDSTSSSSCGNFVTKSSDQLEIASPSGSESGTIVKKLAWKLNGIWMRHAMGICGSREKMVETAALRQRRRGSGPRPPNSRP